MRIAALITWVITAVGGLHMLDAWIAPFGVTRRRTARSRLPGWVILGHFGLAVAGLAVWFVYLTLGRRELAWAALVLLAPTALLGFTMLLRWLPVYRARTASAAETDGPAERDFPVAIVAGHGVFAVATVVLVLLCALNVRGN
jgi:hypothetical protein